MKTEFLLLALIPVLLIGFIPADAREINENQIAVSVEFNRTSITGQFITDYENYVESRIFDKQSKIHNMFTDYSTEANWSMTISDGVMRIGSFIVLSGNTTQTNEQYNEKYNNYVAESRIVLYDFLTAQRIVNYNWDLHYTFGVFSFSE